MKLIGFANRVYLEDLSKSKFLLVFDDHGKEFELPTTQEAVEALVARTTGATKPVPELEEFPDPENAVDPEVARLASGEDSEDAPGATVFGGEEWDEEEDQEEEPVSSPAEVDENGTRSL